MYVSKTYNYAINDNNCNLIKPLMEIHSNFTNKCKEETRRAIIPGRYAIRVNVRIERFHSLIKSYFPGKRAVRGDKLITIIFKIKQTQTVRRFLFYINPKTDN